MRKVIVVFGRRMYGDGYREIDLVIDHIQIIM